MVRTKLSLTCHMKKLGGIRDNRIARIKRRFINAHKRPTAAPAPPVVPIGQPNLSGGVGCSADQLAELDYTFVEIVAKVRVHSGMLRRSVPLTKRFFLPQPATDPDSASNDEDDDDDDEDDNE